MKYRHKNLEPPLKTKLGKIMYSEELNIYELFHRERRYTVPLFQRTYSWNQVDQWEPLWDDIARVTKERDKSNSSAPHFLGAVIVKAPDTGEGFVAKQEIIDGQQRLITLQILIAALRDFAKQHNASPEHQRRLKSLTKNLNVRSNSIEIYKVWPTNVDRNPFQKILNPESENNHYNYSNQNDIQSKTAIPEAYRFFLSKIEEFSKDSNNNLDLNEMIEAFVNAFRKYLSIVLIGLSKDDDPQHIFETMNARGQPLLTSDLIKNYIFKNFDEKKMEEMYSKYWEHFDNDSIENEMADAKRFWYTEIRQSQGRKPRIDLFVFHYLIMKTGRDITLGRLYQEFKDWFEKDSLGPENFLEDFKKFSKLYKKLISPSKSSVLGRFCDRLQHLGGATIYPLLLLLSDIESDESTDCVSFSKCIQSLESYVLRRFVCGLSTQRYNLFFREILETVRKDREPGGQGSTYEIIIAELRKSTAPTSRWPTDKEFLEHWLDRKVYVKSKASRTVMILDALQRHISSTKNESYTSTSKLTVEHLLPQKADLETYPFASEHIYDTRVSEKNKDETIEERRARMIHTIGNLTLLTQSLNSGISNAPFSEKAKAIAEESDLRINAWLRKSDRPSVWDEASILNRGLKLFEVAKEVWPSPTDSSI